MKLFRVVSAFASFGATSASFAVASCRVGDRRSGISVHQRFKNVRVVGVVRGLPSDLPHGADLAIARHFLEPTLLLRDFGNSNFRVPSREYPLCC